ncbi:MAG: hypothetical protein HYY16_08650 [Planctomycetes bacterium]|nr:hypothetical protein [Planctomycetota bacterium]
MKGVTALLPALALLAFAGSVMGQEAPEDFWGKVSEREFDEAVQDVLAKTREFRTCSCR